MQRHIEIYLAEPTSSFCLLLDGADELELFNETDIHFWRKGLHVLDSRWKRLGCCVSQTILQKGVLIEFEPQDITFPIKPKSNVKICPITGYPKVKGLLNITIVL